MLIDIVCLIIVALGGLIGWKTWRKGIMKFVIKVACLVIAFVVARSCATPIATSIYTDKINPYLQDMLTEKIEDTGVPEAISGIQSQIQGFLSNDTVSSAVSGAQSFVEDSELSEMLSGLSEKFSPIVTIAKGALPNIDLDALSKVASVSSPDEAVSAALEIISAPVISILSGIVFCLLFLVVMIVGSIALAFVRDIAVPEGSKIELPFKIIGLASGVLQAVLIVIIGSLVISYCLPADNFLTVQSANSFVCSAGKSVLGLIFPA